MIRADVEGFLGSGLGQTPRDALEDYNLRFMEPLISRNGSERE